MRKKERVRVRCRGPRFFNGNEGAVARGLGPHRVVGVAHHALRDHLGIEPGVLGQCPGHQQLRHADAKPATDQLDEDESLQRRQLLEGGLE